MKWFKHFTDAHNSNKLTKVRMKYGADGYAIYWYCLELVAGDLGENNNINFELKHDSEVIGYNLKIDSNRVEEIMNYMISLALFEESNSQITCLRLAKYLEKRNTRNETIHKIIDAYNAGLPPTVADSSTTVGPMPTLDTDTDTDISHTALPPTVADIPYQEIVSLFNETLGNDLPCVVDLSPERKQRIKARWNHSEKTKCIDWWGHFFSKVKDSDFLMGRKNDFRAGFDWITKKANFIKIVEGNYDNR